MLSHGHVPDPGTVRLRFEMSIDLLLTGIFFISAFTMSFAGFGFAMVAVPLLSLFLPLQEAVALQFPYCMILFMYQAWHYRSRFRWSAMWPMLTGTLAGVSLGAYVLFQLPETPLKRLLSVFIVLFVMFHLTGAGHRFKLAFTSPWFGRLCGFISGSFLGAYNIGGPPAVIYFRTISGSPQETKSYMASYFSGLFVLLTFIYAFTGMFTREILTTSAFYSPVVIFGSFAGFWAFNHVSNTVYNTVIDMALLIVAVMLWFR